MKNVHFTKKVIEISVHGIELFTNWSSTCSCKFNNLMIFSRIPYSEHDQVFIGAILRYTLSNKENIEMVHVIKNYQ